MVDGHGICCNTCWFFRCGACDSPSRMEYNKGYHEIVIQLEHDWLLNVRSPALLSESLEDVAHATMHHIH